MPSNTASQNGASRNSQVPPCTLRGFSNMASVLAFLATKPTHQGGAYKL